MKKGLDTSMTTFTFWLAIFMAIVSFVVGDHLEGCLFLCTSWILLAMDRAQHRD